MQHFVVFSASHTRPLLVVIISSAINFCFCYFASDWFLFLTDQLRHHFSFHYMMASFSVFNISSVTHSSFKYIIRSLFLFPACGVFRLATSCERPFSLFSIPSANPFFFEYFAYYSSTSRLRRLFCACFQKHIWSFFLVFNYLSRALFIASNLRHFPLYFQFIICSLFLISASRLQPFYSFPIRQSFSPTSSSLLFHFLVSCCFLR